MTFDNLLFAFSGLGIFLFSLRFLTQVMDESFSVRVAPSLKKLDTGILRPLLTGVFFTCAVQASSISILTSMGLLGRGLIALETAIYIMLGATLGTSIKAWFFAYSIDQIGPLLVILTSAGLLFIRKPTSRKILEVFLAVGLMFLGWNILGKGLKPFAENQILLDFLINLGEIDFFNLLMAMLVGFALATLVQSSSTVIFVVLGLAYQGVMPFLIGAAVVLGANVGTTMTGLLASLEYGKNVRRLALAHFLVKLIGACMSLLLFKTFLNTIDLLFFNLTAGMQTSGKLAAVHFGFNLINTIIWVILSPFLVKLVRYFIPGKIGINNSLLTKNVVNLLTQVPDRAIEEYERGRRYFKEEIKALEDEIFGVFQLEDNKGHKSDIGAIKSRFRAYEEILQGAMIKDKSISKISTEYLVELGHLKLIFEELILLKDQLASYPQKQMALLNSHLAKHLRKINHLRNRLWYRLLGRSDVQIVTHLREIFYHELELELLDSTQLSQMKNREELHLIYKLSSALLGYFQRLISYAELLQLPEEKSPQKKASIQPIKLSTDAQDAKVQ